MSNFDLGPLIRDNNRRLKKSIGKYFKYKKSKNKDSSIVKSSKRGILSRSEKRITNAAKYIVLIGILTITCFIYYNTSIHLDDYAKKHGEAYAENVIKNNNEIYQFHIKEGNLFIERNDLDEARRSFILARNIFDNGKEANYGMTKCLLLHCQLENKYCTESLAYLNTLQTSKLFTTKEINQLKSINKKQPLN